MRIEWQFAYYPRLWLWWAAGRAGWEFQGARVQQNSGQTMHSHPSNTRILFDPFIIVEVDIASLCVSVICHPWHSWHFIHSVNTSSVLRAVLPPLVREVVMCEMGPLLQEIMLWHWAALGGRKPGVGKLLPCK